MNMTILNPRLLLFLVVSLSTAIWWFYTPMFTFEKYVSARGLIHYLLFYLIIFVCCFLAEKARPTAPNGNSLERFRQSFGKGDGIRREAMALALVAFAAQWLWIARIVQLAGAGEVLRLVFVERDILKFKEQIVNVTGISGVTTLTQLGIVASALYAVYVFGLKNKGSVWMWALILFPGALRGMYFSERIAMLEVLVPIAVMAVIFGKVKVTLTKIVLAAVGFMLFFTAAEGSRSYMYYAKSGVARDGVFSYGLGRLFDYISSSVNHAVAMPELSERTFGFPSMLFGGWINMLYLVVPEKAVRAFLQMNDAGQARLNVKMSPYSAQDYTNMGFFGEIFADAGYLYVVYAIIFGCLAGLAYRGIRQYQVGWMAIYPIVFFALLESYRIPYLFDIRVFYPLLYVALRYAFLSLPRTYADARARPARPELPAFDAIDRRRGDPA